MKEGRELDALIAEKVMGWIKAYSPNLDKDMWYEYLSDTRMMSTKAVDDFFPSEDIADAWLVVNRMVEDGWEPHIEYDVNRSGTWEVTFGHMAYDAEYHIAETAPLAICIAALKAVGVEVG